MVESEKNHLKQTKAKGSIVWANWPIIPKPEVFRAFWGNFPDYSPHFGVNRPTGGLFGRNHFNIAPLKF